MIGAFNPNGFKNMKSVVARASDPKVSIKGLVPKSNISKQPVERRHGLLARAIRGNKDPGGALPTPQDSGS